MSVDAASHAIAGVHAPIALWPALCAGYSACSEFIHGPAPPTVWLATLEEGGFHGWIWFGIFLRNMRCEATSIISFSVFINLDRECQICATAWYGLLYVGNIYVSCLPEF